MTTLDMYPDYKKKKSGSATLDREGKICENLCVKVIFKFDFRYKLFKIQTLFQARKRKKTTTRKREGGKVKCSCLQGCGSGILKARIRIRFLILQTKIPRKIDLESSGVY